MVHDGTLITGQNPWSVWTLAEQVVKQLGYEPIAREITSEQHSVAVLLAYETHGTAQARALVESLLAAGSAVIDRNLIARHAMVAAYQGRQGKAVDLIGLLRVAKRLSA